jgi:hypothetical protein
VRKQGEGLVKLQKIRTPIRLDLVPRDSPPTSFHRGKSLPHCGLGRTPRFVLLEVFDRIWRRIGVIAM